MQFIQSRRIRSCEPTTVKENVPLNLNIFFFNSRAMKFVWERMKLVIEPSAAVPLAVALFSEEFRETFKYRKSAHEGGRLNVGIIFSGGNVDLTTVSSLFEQV